MLIFIIKYFTFTIARQGIQYQFDVNVVFTCHFDEDINWIDLKNPAFKIQLWLVYFVHVQLQSNTVPSLFHSALLLTREDKT